MRSGRSLVRICGFSSSSFITYLQQIHDLSWLIYIVLVHTSYLDSFDWVVSQVKYCLLAVSYKQVSYDLIVYLYIWHPYLKVFVFVLAHLIKHILQNQVHYSRGFICASHCVSFTWTSSPIRKYTSIVSLNDWIQEAVASAFVNLPGVALLVENTIKEILLLFASVKHVRFLTVVLAF